MQDATVIGPYNLTGILGSGAMGVIYSASHARTGQVAAVKTVLKQEASKLSQIRREIHALASLDHPGIVKILDYGESNSQPWYAMEWLEGSTLRDLIHTRWGEHKRRSKTRRQHFSIDEGPESTVNLTMDPLLDDLLDDPTDGQNTPFPVGAKAAAGQLIESLSLIQRVCETLSFLHGEGLVHRDLKPDNIFIRKDGLPVLVDFGLAADARGTIGREQITAMHRAAGSPAYMPPEQIRGEMLDARCDLYAIGCVLYNLVTGSPPFTGSEKQVTKGHLWRAPVPPTSVISDVPQGLNKLIMDLLAKDPDERMGYAENVAMVLESVGTNPLPWNLPLPKVRAYIYRSAFVGHKELMRATRDRLTDPLEGRGRCIMVAGESGAGKTRFALETASLALRRSMTVITGECLPGGRGDDDRDDHVHSAPLQPLRSFTEMVADYCIEHGREAQDEILGEHAALLGIHFPAIAKLPGIRDLPPPPPLPVDAARTRIFRAMRDCLNGFAAIQPILLILDDLQWADELTLGFVNFILDNALENMPILLLCTFRSEERTEEIDQLTGGALVSNLELTQLSVDEVQQMTSGMLALQQPPSEFIRFLAQRSSGNPFFIAEYLRCAVAAKVLVRDSYGRWTCAENGSLDSAVFEKLPLPQSLKQLIELRLSKLSRAARRLVDTAALVGRVFDLSLIQQVEWITEDKILDLVEELIRRQILEQSEDGRYRFLHDKIREIAESYLRDDEKSQLHGKIAIAFENAQSPDADIDHARLGRHWALAGEPERAAPHLGKAAHHAASIHAVSEAANLARAALREIRAIRARNLENEERWRREALGLYELLGDMHALQADYAKSRMAFAAADNEIRDEIITRTRLARKSGKTWEKEHKHEQALESYSQAEDVLEDNPDDSLEWRHEWIQIKLDRIWVFYWLAQVRDIEAELNEVRPFVETVGLPEHKYHYFMSLVNRNHRLHRYQVPDETLDYARQMLAAAEESNGPVEIAFAHFVYGFALLFADKLERAEAELFEARQACQRIGDVSGDARAAAYLTILYRRQGRIAETEAGARELLKIAQPQKMMDYVGVAYASLGWVAWKKGDGPGITQNNQMAWQAWRDLSFPHPFQWTAAFTELRLSLGWASTDKLMEIVHLLHNPPQMQLPDSINSVLAETIAAHGRGEQQDIRNLIEQALRAAEDLHYL
ncbi:protein kinase domain-containing protein [Aestuariispira insulae]|uniref:Putative ATPase n=1 Tax=Aestuariispira insulae TaxID=1461337 RepID=A0A3D9H1I8_9PROT|nr:protein kinase [Aestuariispira insulae]RED43372.1 putative ATPase [Aestuariispira insulae]